MYGLNESFEHGYRNALNGAVVMSQRLAKLNKRLQFELDTPLKMGIGIHSGEAIVGTMGPPSSPILSAIGDNINIAARLEPLTKEYECDLIVSEDTIRGAGLQLEKAGKDTVAVRGKNKPIDILVIKDITMLNDVI